MSRRGTLILQYDAPDSADAWVHGPHYDELLSVPGVISISRYKRADKVENWRQYMVIIESDDVDATLAWRNGPNGKRSQDDAGQNGLRNRSGAWFELIYAGERGQPTKASGSGRGGAA